MQNQTTHSDSSSTQVFHSADAQKSKEKDKHTSENKFAQVASGRDQDFKYSKHFGELLSGLQEEGAYRTFVNIKREVGKFPTAHWWNEKGEKEEVTVWCSNDYLGMGHNAQVISAIHEAVDTMGAGAGGTRNISGTHKLIVELEEELKDLYQKSGALVFSSGYVANEASLSVLGQVLPDCHIFSDEYNHDSLIQGIRHSRAKKFIFKHNDVASLENLLEQSPLGVPKIVVFESVYSMDGHLGPINEICECAKKYGALTYLDETHAGGLYGKQGSGKAEEQNALDKIDLIQGGLGKGFGVIGGFVVGNEEVMDTIRSFGRGFIFTTSIPPAVAAGALASIRYLRKCSTEREKLQQNVEKLKLALANANLPIMDTESHIVPVLIGDATLAKKVSENLLRKHKIYVQPINFPSVPRGTERLRITITAAHTEENIAQLVHSLKSTGKELGLWQ